MQQDRKEKGLEKYKDLEPLINADVHRVFAVEVPLAIIK